MSVDNIDKSKTERLVSIMLSVFFGIILVILAICYENGRRYSRGYIKVGDNDSIFYYEDEIIGHSVNFNNNLGIETTYESK